MQRQRGARGCQGLWDDSMYAEGCGFAPIVSFRNHPAVYEIFRVRPGHELPKSRAQDFRGSQGATELLRGHCAELDVEQCKRPPLPCVKRRARAVGPAARHRVCPPNLGWPLAIIVLPKMMTKGLCTAGAMVVRAKKICVLARIMHGRCEPGARENKRMERVFGMSAGRPRQGGWWGGEMLTSESVEFSVPGASSRLPLEFRETSTSKAAATLASSSVSILSSLAGSSVSILSSLAGSSVSILSSSLPPPHAPPPHPPPSRR